MPEWAAVPVLLAPPACHACVQGHALHAVDAVLWQAMPSTPSASHRSLRPQQCSSRSSSCRGPYLLNATLLDCQQPSLPASPPSYGLSPGEPAGSNALRFSSCCQPLQAWGGASLNFHTQYAQCASPSSASHMASWRPLCPALSRPAEPSSVLPTASPDLPAASPLPRSSPTLPPTSPKAPTSPAPGAAASLPTTPAPRTLPTAAPAGTSPLPTAPAAGSGPLSPAGGKKPVLDKLVGILLGVLGGLVLLPSLALAVRYFWRRRRTRRQVSSSRAGACWRRRAAACCQLSAEFHGGSSPA